MIWGTILRRHFGGRAQLKFKFKFKFNNNNSDNSYNNNRSLFGCSSMAHDTATGSHATAVGTWGGENYE